MRNSLCTVLSAVLLFSTIMAWSYDDAVTHPALSSQAAEKSTIYHGPLLTRLGLPPTSALLFRYRGRNGDRLTRNQKDYNLAQLIGEGAFDEDQGSRALNHFYDPLLDRPLRLSPQPDSRRSWEWMLETNGPITGQDGSLSDAKEYFYQALTFKEGASTSVRCRTWKELGPLRHIEESPIRYSDMAYTKWLDTNREMLNAQREVCGMTAVEAMATAAK